MGTTADKLNKLLDTKAAIKAAIKAKGQSVSDSDIFASYAGKISAIDTLSSGTADATAAAGDILSGKTAYVKGAKVTGNIATKTESNLSVSGATVTVPAGYYAAQATKSVATATHATPSISVDSAGKITASATQSAGYVGAGTKTATQQLTTQAAKTVTPGTSDQIAVASGVYTTGAVTVKGDADLVAANIVEGKEIFGVTGNAEPASGLSPELTTQGSLIAQITAALEGKMVPSSNPKLIDFTIVYGVSSYPTTLSCQAEEGMTIGSWIYSDYNTNHFGNGSGSGFVTNYRTAYYYDAGTSVYAKITLAGTEVDANDVIQSGATYYATYSYCCFVAGTQVLTSLDGETKNIEDFVVGDQVVSYNIETGENYLAKVKRHIIKTDTTDIAEVTFENGSILVMNAYHPIYTVEGWHSLTNYNGYDTLTVGDTAKTFGGWSEVVDIKRYTSEPITTYNLDVVDIDEEFDVGANDTFYANGVVVHNDC